MRNEFLVCAVALIAFAGRAARQDVAGEDLRSRPSAGADAKAPADLADFYRTPVAIRSFRDGAREIARRKIAEAGDRRLATGGGFDGLFLWDAAFSVMWARHLDPNEFPYLETLDRLYSLADEEGFIAREFDAKGRPVWSSRHPVSFAPPLLSWAEAVLFREGRSDLSRVKRVYPILRRHHEACRAKFRRDDGLYFGDLLGSGMDDLVRWPADFSPERRAQGGIAFTPESISPTSRDLIWKAYGSHAADFSWNRQAGWIDLSSQMALDCLSLAALAEAAGEADEAAAFRREHGEIAAAVNSKCWDEERGFYFDVTDRGVTVRYMAAAFWALLARIPGPDRAKRMISKLFDPDYFGRPVMVPALARCEKAYDPEKGYWNGPCWPPLTYMTICALRENGFVHEAEVVARRWYDANAALYSRTGTVFENISPEQSGHPKENADRDFCGWGALAPIALPAESGWCDMPDVMVMPSPRSPVGAATEALKPYYEAGFRTFSDIWTMRGPQPLRQWWLGEGKYDWRLFDDIARAMLAVGPAAVIVPRIKLEPPEDWIRENPSEMCIDESGRCGEVRPGSAKWQALYRRMLADMVRHVETSDYADRVIGYHLGAFHCGEWHVYPAANCPAPMSKQDVSSPLPPWEVTAGRREYYRKWSGRIADHVIDCCSLMRRLTRGEKRLGVFFGYWGMTHQDAMRVVESGCVDFVAAPPEYREKREPGRPGRSQAFYQASFRLHGVEYYEESDFRTALSDWGDGTATYGTRPVHETVGMLRRTIGKEICGGWKNWWFLLGGNGSFNAPESFSTIRRGHDYLKVSGSIPWRPAEVAVFTSIDEYHTSNCALDFDSFGVKYKNGFHMDELPCCGVPFDSYELGDVENARLPDYRVYVFPNAFTLTESQREAIKRKVRRSGKTAVWVYAPGYYRGEKGDWSNVRDLTGGEGAFFDHAPTSDELRETFRKAGVHVWNETGDMIAAGREHVMLHAAESGEHVIRLPRKADAFEIFDAGPALKGVDEIRLRLRKGDTVVYRLAPVTEDGGGVMRPFGLEKEKRCRFQ